MRRIIGLAFFLVLALHASAFAEGVKVGIVNLKMVIEKSDPGLDIQKNLQSKFDKMKGDIEKQKNDIERMRDEMQKQSVAMTPEAKQDKELSFKRKVRDYQDTVMAYQRKMKAEEEQATAPVFELLSNVVKEYAKKNKFTLLIDVAGPLNNVIYYDEAVDVTNDVMTELNKSWKGKK